MNQVIRWQIISPDPDATTHFYEKLFGWTWAAQNSMAYREVSTGDGGIDGGVWPAPREQQPMVQLFVEVDDVGAYAERATGLGAKVIVPDSQLPDGDRMAILSDPVGMTIGICTLAQRR